MHDCQSMMKFISISCFLDPLAPDGCSFSLSEQILEIYWIKPESMISNYSVYISSTQNGKWTNLTSDPLYILTPDKGLVSGETYEVYINSLTFDNVKSKESASCLKTTGKN